MRDRELENFLHSRNEAILEVIFFFCLVGRSVHPSVSRSVVFFLDGTKIVVFPPSRHARAVSKALFQMKYECSERVFFLYA